jgi:flagellar FliL protein
MARPKQMVLYAQAGLLIPLIVTTVLAIAIGGGEGMLATKLGVAPNGAASEPPKAEAAHAPAPEGHGAKPEAHGEKGKEGKEAHGEKGKAPVVLTGTVIRDLPPIVTNIAMPEDTWIRLESSVVFDAEKLPEPDVAIKEITGDILSYLRTLSLTQVQGARGLRNLREDLNERVAIRTDGKVKELLIQGMVLQ